MVETVPALVEVYCETYMHIDSVRALIVITFLAASLSPFAADMIGAALRFLWKQITEK